MGRRILILRLVTALVVGAAVLGCRGPDPVAVHGSPSAIGDATLQDVQGTGSQSRLLDLLPGVYVVTVYGDTLELDILMEATDGRGRMTWGRVPVVSFAVGQHFGAALYPGETYLSVTAPTEDTWWGLLLEHHAYP